MSEANKRQVGGNHYKQGESGAQEHWDRAWKMRLDPFQYQITKYVERWRGKNGIQDLEKAQHFLEKYIELVKEEQAKELFDQLNKRKSQDEGKKPEDNGSVNKEYEAMIWIGGSNEPVRFHVITPSGEIFKNFFSDDDDGPNYEGDNHDAQPIKGDNPQGGGTPPA